MFEGIFKKKREDEGAENMNTVLLDSASGGKSGLFSNKGKLPIGEREIAEAAKILAEYKAGKTNLESRIVEDEQWWEIRHWDAIKGKSPDMPTPSSAWLFNAIINKHADAMDNYPEPIVLPRERADEGSAKTLSSVLPVILECNDYENVYSDNWWEKLKHGTAAYGVFWDSKREGGIGDISISQIDLLKLFWEPGITKIQDSANLFIVNLVDEELLDMQYPEHKGKLKGNVIDVKEYVYDDSVDTSKKSVCVDWYYKKNIGGRTVLHFAKFVGKTLLFASENEPAYQESGWYEHGMYPVVLDVLFPEKGTPIGFGYVAICKDPQLYIDKLSSNIQENAMMATKKRFFVSDTTDMNMDEFADWSKPFVHVSGQIDETRIKEIVTRPLDSIYVSVLDMKIAEMKDTAANRDVNSGGTGSGVTAASAIAALQEAGNKVSRDMIAASYRAHTEINRIVVELMRQFYDESRAFRITGENGNYEFVDFSNADLKEQPMPRNPNLPQMGAEIYRKPIFDIKIRAQKKNPFSRMEQNERAKELYGLGFFDPNRAEEALAALDMMDFEGIEKVREKAKNGQTLLSMCQQLSSQLNEAMGIIASLTGAGPGGGAMTVYGRSSSESTNKRAGSGSSVSMPAPPKMSYAERLAERSKPSVESVYSNTGVR